MTDDRAFRPPHLTLAALFRLFLGFGLRAFGGPVAQIAMLRQALVEEGRWITPARFNRLLAVMQALPGPEAHELAVHLGMLARGRLGGLLAGLGFMLPGFVLMLAAAWAYGAFLGDVVNSSLLAGVQVAVLAIILRAVWRIGAHVLEDRLLAALAVGAFALTLVGTPFWIPLVAAGLGYAMAGRAWLVAAVGAAGLGLVLATLPGPGAATVVPLGATPATTAALFVAGLKGGLLTFGGAYTAIPYVRADTVGRGWLSDATFLDGVAVAGVLPAPLVIFATFVGYVAGGPAGAVAITAGMFLPAFALSLILFERLERLVEAPALHRLLTGIAAAVVGIIAATALQLGQAAVGRATQPAVALAIFAVALAAAWRLKGGWAMPAIIAFGAAAGWALHP